MFLPAENTSFPGSSRSIFVLWCHNYCRMFLDHTVVVSFNPFQNKIGPKLIEIFVLKEKVSDFRLPLRKGLAILLVDVFVTLHCTTISSTHVKSVLCNIITWAGLISSYEVILSTSFNFVQIVNENDLKYILLIMR